MVPKEPELPGLAQNSGLSEDPPERKCSERVLESESANQT
jgi:hypothetical protein